MNRRSFLSRTLGAAAGCGLASWLGPRMAWAEEPTAEVKACVQKGLDWMAKNQNPDGISLNKVVSELKRLNDPKRPVRLVLIGIGNDVDSAELQTIAKATPAGGVFIAPDETKMSSIFLSAIANRTGTSN